MAIQPVSNIRILLVISADAYERLGSVIQHLCVGMVDEPVRIVVLSRSREDRAGDAIGPSRVVRAPRSFWKWRSPSSVEILDLADMDAPEVVHCFSADLVPWVRHWCLEWGSALVVHLSDLQDVRTFCDLKLGGQAMGIAATARLEEALLEQCPEIHERLRVVPHGVPAQPEPACLARPERIPAVIVSATLTRECGVEQVLFALQEIIRSGQELQLFLLASGPAEGMYRRLVEELGLRAFVTFAGPIEDWASLKDAMRSADMYISPGGDRRFTIHSLNAMASGLAVIAPAGTVEDYLVDGVTASLFDPLDPMQLTARWAALLDDRSAARDMAHRALDHVRAHHQASTMVTAVAWLYQEACRSVPVI